MIVVVAIGMRLEWQPEQILVLGFVMMLNSTAVVSEYLKKIGEVIRFRSGTCSGTTENYILESSNALGNIYAVTVKKA